MSGAVGFLFVPDAGEFFSVALKNTRKYSFLQKIEFLNNSCPRLAMLAGIAISVQVVSAIIQKCALSRALNLPNMACYIYKLHLISHIWLVDIEVKFI